MARAEIVPADLSRNALTSSTAFQTVDSSTGAYISLKSTAHREGSKVLFILGSTENASFSVRAGQYTAKGVGTLTGSLTAAGSTAGACFVVGPLETARFKDTDDYISIDGTSNSFRVSAIVIP